MLLFQFFQLMKVCVCCEKGIALRSVLGVDLIGVEIWVHFDVWEGNRGCAEWLHLLRRDC